MPLSHSRARSSTFPAAAGLTAVLLSCALLTGCGDPAAKADSDRNQALTAALADYGSVATSHLSSAGGVPAGVYEDQVVLSKDKAWKPDLKALRPDLALLTARLD